MTLDPASLDAVIAELDALAGSRIQRIDLYGDQELVLELRSPGRTHRLLLSTRKNLGRIHMIDRRPVKLGPGSALQAALRKRLEGRPLLALRAELRTVHLAVPGCAVVVRLEGGRDAITFAASEGEASIPPTSPPERAVPERFPISEDIAARYGARAERSREQDLRRGLLEPVEARRKKLKRLLANLAGDEARLTEMRRARSQAELLKSVFSKIQRGSTSVTVTDYESGLPIAIPLDPALNGQANMEKLFARAKKADRGLPQIVQRRADTERRLSALDLSRQQIQAAGDLAALEALAMEQPEAAEREPHGAGTASKKARAADRFARRYVGSGGLEILVGKGAEANDRLTFGMARGHDLWLHARDVPGAHVLLRLEKGQSPPSEAMLDAAHLAAYHSDARREAKVEVIYAEARYVKRTKGAPAGQVGVAREKTMLVSVDRARLERLLGSVSGQ